MYRILIVEDDSDINQMICEYLNGGILLLPGLLGERRKAAFFYVGV